MTWPLPFIEQMKNRLGTAMPDLLEALSKDPVTAIRLNPGKPEISLPWATTSIPWSARGYYLDDRPSFTTYPPFHAGALYVQEPSSMFIEQAVAATQLQGPLLALDLCGAPGGKSTHLLSLLSKDSLLVSNEVIQSRASILAENIIKWGSPNTLVTQLDPEVIARTKVMFDLVVVDAPCSGEGLFRKDAQAAKEWSMANVKHCAARQDRILEAAMKVTAPGGFLIYSTCTFEGIENEAHSALFREAAWQCCPIPMGEHHGITPLFYQGHLAGYQLYPHKVKGEGFFLSLWQKPGERLPRRWSPPTSNTRNDDWTSWVAEPNEWVAVDRKNTLHLVPKILSGTITSLVDSLQPRYFGLAAFTRKGPHLRPTQALAMSGAVSNTIPTLAVDEADALRYLARENLQLEAPKGWHLITYQDLPLGWAKGLGHRINNYYPQHWRIKNLDKLR